MKIRKIKLTHFRSIKTATIDVSDFNVFVGQNNCGKTNLFEALEWFYKGTPKGTDLNQLRWKRKPENQVSIEIEFSGAQEGAAKMQHEANRTKIINALAGADDVSIKRSEEGKRDFIVNGAVVKTGTGFDTALNDFLPKFEYIHTKQYFDAVAKYAKATPIGIMLAGVLGTILETNEQYKEFQEKFKQLFDNSESAVRKEFDVLGGQVRVHLRKQFPDCANVKFEVAIPEFDDLLKSFETKVDDGVETTAEEKGDGMQRALMLAIIQAYAEYRRKGADIGKAFLFFIDEAELHLHPSAQRKLKEVLLELAKQGDQVFINSHSSVFVADDHSLQKLFKVEKSDDGESDIDPIKEQHKPYVVYELLGGSPADLLLPRNFLIVEGPSEVWFLSNVIDRNFPDKPRIQIIPARGDFEQAEKTINSIAKAFSPLEHTLYGDRLVVLIDRPHVSKEAGVADFLNNNKALKDSKRFFELPCGSLEEYYPAHLDWRRTAAQVSAMTGKQKVKLAKRVGGEITQQQLLVDMPQVLVALERCWEKAC